MVWFLLLMMATACAACESNLEHQMFVFPRTSNIDRVKMDSAVNSFQAATVCLRFKTDLHRDYVLFSLSTAHQPDTFVIFYDYSKSEFVVEINGHDVDFKGFHYEPNTWHSICATWDGAAGLVQLWFDGHHSPRRHASGSSFNHPCIIIGQEQDSFCSDFNQHESFVGLMTDVNMWSYTLNTCEIQSYMNYKKICSGNAVDWSNLSFHIYGKVSVLPRPICSKELFLTKFVNKDEHGRETS